MPEGPLGLPRLTYKGPFVEKTRNETIEEDLGEFSRKVTVNSRGPRDRFTFRIDIPSGSDTFADEKVRDAFPTSQNIPSNMSVIGESAEGVIRPPLVSKSLGSEDQIKNRIKSTTTSDVEVALPDSGGGRSYRPHIIVGRVSLEDFLLTVKEIHQNFVEEVINHA